METKWLQRQGVPGDLFSILLTHLGVPDTNAINAWFKKSYAGQYRIDGFDRVKALLDANRKLPVHIFGDYDVDGRTATAILYRGLIAYGFEKVSWRIPRRKTEGFGLNPGMVREIEDKKAVIITCDNGIASLEACALAKERGFTVIVTDHHEPVVENGQVILPKADVIIDPKAIPGSADFTGYCGAGIAYKLISYLLGPERKAEAKLLEPLAAVATICDAMPLVEENYVIVRNGLKKIVRREAPAGLLALSDTMGVENVTAENVAFRIGPPINAPGRLCDEDGLTLPLLTTDDYRFGRILSDQVKGYNETRKELKAKGVEEAEARIKAEGLENDPVITVYLPGINEGLVGILAGDIAERYGRPAIVVTDSAEPMCVKGSARSVEGVNIKALFDANAGLFVRYGGHEGAAGLTLQKQNLKKLRAAMNASVKPVLGSRQEVSYYDHVISCSDVPAALAMQEKFEPFGVGNAKPIFKIEHFRMVPNKNAFKKEMSAGGVKLFSANCEAIGFGMTERMAVVDGPMELTLYGTLSYNVFRGTKSVQINYTDFEIADDNGTDMARRLREIGATKAE